MYGAPLHVVSTKPQLFITDVFILLLNPLAHGAEMALSSL